MPKLLAWMSLGLALLFVALALTGVFGWDSLGEETARMLFYFGALSLLLAVVLLGMSAFQSRE
jgi:ABC-type transport system involved in multi-copper enzyme maturation permease subunit